MKSVAWLAFACAALVGRAGADEIVLKSGSVDEGRITGVSGGQVSIQPKNSTGNLLFGLNLIQSVNMAPPAEMTNLKGATPDAVIATLGPLVKQYAGLPADWVIDAMSQLADAYDTEGKTDQASAIYAQINQLYPNSPYQAAAVAGQAKVDLKGGKVDAALAELKPFVDKANQNLAPSPQEGRIDGNIFLVYGQALQAKKQYPQALEAYLTVETMFYQNPALVDQAEQLTAALRQQDPGVGVD